MADYNVWLERVRPLGVYLIVTLAIAALGVVVRARPAAGDVIDIVSVVVAFAAPVAIVVRGRTFARSVILGTQAPLSAVVLGIAGGLAGSALAAAAAALAHGGVVPWAVLRPPRPEEHWVVLALALPNALAATVVFQGWLQTKLLPQIGVWGAAAAALAIYAFGDRNAVAVAYALAPVALRATNGSLLACACAYLTASLVANL